MKTKLLELTIHLYNMFWLYNSSDIKKFFKTIKFVDITLQYSLAIFNNDYHQTNFENKNFKSC